PMDRGSSAAVAHGAGRRGRGRLYTLSPCRACIRCCIPGSFRIADRFFDLCVVDDDCVAFCRGHDFDMAQDQSRRGVIGGGRALVQWALSVCLALPCIPCFADQGDLRLEIETLPGFQRYDRLLEHPGYIAVALENIDIRPSSSTKLILRDRGREVEARNVILRFTGKTATSYSYEAGVSLGIGSASVTIPVTVDLSALPAGKTIVVAKLPLATLL